MFSKWKASNGRWLTKALFWETSYVKEGVDTRALSMYTLWDDDRTIDGKVYISLKKLYLGCEDPTEYQFATTYLGGWQHWQKLLNAKDLDKNIAEWREEYAVKLKSVGAQKIIEIAKEEGSFQAAKWLADKKWLESSAGRPSKQQINQNIKENKAVKKALSGDLVKLQEYKDAKRK